ncbi:MAG: single-stranded-DNA-specific exonuclease RecJ [Phycisphaerales bacterium]|jgi:single-stranded-DNA-specific exonuclease|nr:single-stranded-DNA-specific exonuclease RecJ [Phycisphaerales bacterium]
MARVGWSPNRLRWEFAEPFDGAETLMSSLRLGPMIAQVLHNRGLDDPLTAGKFLDPKLNDLHDPELLSGAVEAAELIAKAVADKRKIVIYGDYDVDGITATAILHAVLRLVDANVDYYVPHRMEEGYGLNVEAIDKLVADGAEMLITVDCGVSAVEAVAHATAAGLEVIVTDHHTLGDELPPASAIVHPSLPDSKYPNVNLAGAGVAFKLAWQVARAICGSNRVDAKMRQFLLDATCFAALGTIADVVPLLGENRLLAKFGLDGLKGTEHTGLRALLESAGLTGEKLDSYHVGFVLGPRLNAAGRMGHARLAVEMLTGASRQRSCEIAEYLDTQNTERRKVQDDITAQAVEMVQAQGFDSPDRRAIVVGGDNWHGGVIGIVAARLVSRFGRPAIVISLGDEVSRGSGRSIDGFNMHTALTACSEHLEGFGGHAMAAGVTLDRNNLEAFSEAFVAYASAHITDQQLVPVLKIDATATLADINYDTVRSLTKMAPFGQGNPAPVVVVKGCRVLVAPKRIGASGTTVSMTLGQDGVNLRAIGFGMGDLTEALVGVNTVDVAFEPQLNTFRGNTTVQAMLRDVRWD